MKATANLLLEQIVRFERRSGRRAVGVTVAVPARLDGEAVLAALRLLLDAADLDLAFVILENGGPRVLTVDFELDEF